MKSSSQINLAICFTFHWYEQYSMTTHQLWLVVGPWTIGMKAEIFGQTISVFSRQHDFLFFLEETKTWLFYLQKIYTTFQKDPSKKISSLLVAKYRKDRIVKSIFASKNKLYLIKFNHEDLIQSEGFLTKMQEKRP